MRPEGSKGGYGEDNVLTRMSSLIILFTDTTHERKENRAKTKVLKTKVANNFEKEILEKGSRLPPISSKVPKLVANNFRKEFLKFFLKKKKNF